MPTDGEMPHDQPVASGQIPPDRRMPEDDAEKALWRLYAEMRGLDPADPGRCRPRPEYMADAVRRRLADVEGRLIEREGVEALLWEPGR